MRNLGKNKEEFFEESWNKKRVFLALLSVLTIGAGFFYAFNSDILKDKKSQNLATKTQSEHSKVLSAQDFEEDVRKQVDAIKEQAANINLEEIASSSPQIQNLVNDIKALQDLPRNQAREACMNICKSF
ncbi:MAG: hypothetical protein A2629_01890 [Candidatus Levybacteria bacterium RIFCSPHIGHO2_01_FULL_41_15]|nr:MAG: hypothetical protein A2629_01890 [Candidatus Levybacteria bacterium RIFCSPHIGHO2_01_FULL_41_15]